MTNTHKSIFFFIFRFSHLKYFFLCLKKRCLNLVDMISRYDLELECFLNWKLQGCFFSKWGYMNWNCFDQSGTKWCILKGFICRLIIIIILGVSNLWCSKKNIFLEGGGHVKILKNRKFFLVMKKILNYSKFYETSFTINPTGIWIRHKVHETFWNSKRNQEMFWINLKVFLNKIFSLNHPQMS